MRTFSTQENISLWSLPDAESISKPIPLTTFLLKIASRCNLDCDYCYVYHKADQSWRVKPKLMSYDVIDKALDRIFEHVKANDLKQIFIIVHGGEPLLAGLELIEYVFGEAKKKSKDLCDVELGMQSNGVLIDEATIDLFNRFEATIGISIDGTKEANDRHRLFRNGKSSFKRVEKALELMTSSPKGQKVFSGFLAVIDLRNDPIEMFNFLNTFKPRNIDFLLPDGTHEDYPPQKNSFTETPYADWLIKLFDYWFKLPDGTVPIKYFCSIISLLLGGKDESESIGLAKVNLIVVEANGEIEGVDTLKVAFNGAPALNANVFNASFDEILYHPAVLSRMQGINSLARECRSCPLVEICGGGYIPHRFSTERGFANPSIYCHDIAKLILHIRKHVKAAIK